MTDHRPRWDEDRRGPVTFDDPPDHEPPDKVAPEPPPDRTTPETSAAPRTRLDLRIMEIAEEFRADRDASGEDIALANLATALARAEASSTGAEPDPRGAGRIPEYPDGVVAEEYDGD